jgi:hypothetical protein
MKETRDPKGFVHVVAIMIRYELSHFTQAIVSELESAWVVILWSESTNFFLS